MESIQMTELKVGDIFCHEMKLHGRKAFLVVEIKETQIICEDRQTKLETKKQKKGSVLRLRNIYDEH